jgi:hypothetical protein
MRATALSAAAALLALAAHSPAAQAAADLSIDGGIGGAITSRSGNSLVGGLFGNTGLDGIFGGQLVLQNVAADSTVDLVFDLFGYEAGYNTGFVTGSTVAFTSPLSRELAPDFDNPLDSFRLTAVSGGLVDFGFGLNRTDGVVSLANGENSVSRRAGFFLSIADTPERPNSQAYIFLDDGGGGPDNDYDDMFLRVRVDETARGGNSSDDSAAAQMIREPATLAVVGVGLIGAGIALRRRTIR